MARRKDHTHQELRKMSVQAGAALIAEHGLQGFSLRKVAAEIGYTPGALYNIFEDIDDLLIHVHEQTLDALFDHLSQVEIDADKGKEALQALAYAYLAFARENRYQWQALFDYSRPDDKPLPLTYNQKLDTLFGLIEMALPDDVEGDRSSLITVLWASIHGICTLSLSSKLQHSQGVDPEKLIDELLERVSL